MLTKKTPTNMNCVKVFNFTVCFSRTLVVPRVEDSNQIMQDLRELSALPDNSGYS